MNKKYSQSINYLSILLSILLISAFSSSCARSIPTPQVELADAQRQIVEAVRPVPEKMKAIARVD